MIIKEQGGDGEGRGYHLERKTWTKIQKKRGGGDNEVVMADG